MASLSNFKGKPKGENESEKVSEEQLAERVDKYKDMSQSELKSELFSEVARQKREGKFDYNALQGMVESVKGVISDEQYKNISSLLEEFK